MVAPNDSPVPNARRPRFELGGSYATPGALRALEEAGQDARELFIRHGNGDWGEVGAEDAAANDAALDQGERLLSAYVLPRTAVKVWLITEADRSVTTILLPDEY